MNPKTGMISRMACSMILRNKERYMKDDEILYTKAVFEAAKIIDKPNVFYLTMMVILVKNP